MKRNEKIINDTLINEIINCLSSKNTVPSEIADIFVVRSMQVIQKADPTQISERYSVLSKLIAKCMRDCLHNYIEDDALSFRIGQISACVSMINEMIMANKEEELLISRKAYFKNNIELFNIIDSEEDGITHSELAKRLGKSPSGLSQLIAKIRYFDYITYSTIGREKYYFLTDSGKTMLDNLRKDVPIEDPTTAVLPEKSTAAMGALVINVICGLSSEFYVKEDQTFEGLKVLTQGNSVSKEIRFGSVVSADGGSYSKAKTNLFETSFENYLKKSIKILGAEQKKSFEYFVGTQFDYSGVEICINQATKA